MKKLIVALIFISTLASCGKGNKGASASSTPATSAITTSEVLGTWHLLDVQQDSLKSSLYLKVESDRVSSIAVCVDEKGQSISASTTVAAKVSNTSIVILKSGKSSKELNGSYCSAEIDEGTLNFVIINGGKTLHPTEDSLPDAQKVL